jgi:hypothetical protein
MLKNSLLILPLLSTISVPSIADVTGNLTGQWNGVIVESVAGLMPGANVGTTVIVEKISITNDGAITGSATSSIVGSQATIEGKIDSSGEFTLHTNDEAEECQISGTYVRDKT